MKEFKDESQGEGNDEFKKWISAGVLALLVGTGAAAMTVQAAAYDREETVVAEEREEGAAAATAKVSAKAWKRINGISYNGSGVAITPRPVTRELTYQNGRERLTGQRSRNQTWILLLCGSHMEPDIWIRNMLTI